MPAGLDSDFLSSFLSLSRAAFLIETDGSLAVRSASRGYFRGIGEPLHTPVGRNLRELLAGGTKTAARLSELASQGGMEPVALTFLPPFPQPRNVSGVALGADGRLLLLLERDVDTVGADYPAPERSFVSEAGVHKELFATQDELSRLRRDLSQALDRLAAIEDQRAMLQMLVPMISAVADKAKDLSSLALIISTRLGGENAENDELLAKLEAESAKLHEFGKRLGRGLG